jgi:hypothetical protein
MLRALVLADLGLADEPAPHCLAGSDGAVDGDGVSVDVARHVMSGVCAALR